MESIAAISTAPGTGGVAIIRISGDQSVNIAEKMFLPAGKTSVACFEPYKMYVGEIDAGDFKDNGMCVIFKAPKSFTGEDVVEFHCHGGTVISHGILERIFELGARPATNGEFTKRAFLNGKLSLSSCEGLIDMINSESVAQIKSGFYLFKEKLKEKIVDLQAELTVILAGIDANIDYPEEGLIEDDGEEIRQKLVTVKKTLERLVDSYSEGRVITDGVKVALVGNTNTGKSSLLNLLTGEQRAIVTSVAGTTRDVVEGNVFIGGIKFTLYDTAGIRETDDPVEKIGIKRSNDLIDSADVIVFVTDGNETAEEMNSFCQRLNDKKVIRINNKADLFCENSNKAEKNYDDLSCGCLSEITFSCATGEGRNELCDALYSLGAGGVKTDGDYVTQKRHYYALKDALSAIDSAIERISDTPLDLVACDIKECWSKLGEITGTTASEDIINEIFLRFCVGK